MSHKPYKMFLDDLRQPPDNTWIVVRSYDTAVEYVRVFGMPETISFDHDLGLDKTGYDFAKFIVDLDLDLNVFTPEFRFYVHSANPVGASNIKNLLDGYLAFKFPVA